MVFLPSARVRLTPCEGRVYIYSLRPQFAALGREQKFSLLSASLEQIPLKCSGAVSKEALMSF